MMQADTIDGVDTSSPSAVEPMHNYRGDVNYIRKGKIFGWAWNPSAPDDHLHILLTQGDTLLVKVAASLFRKDLRAAGIGDGKHAFAIPIPQKFRRGGLHRMEVRFENGALVKRGEVEIGAAPGLEVEMVEIEAEDTQLPQVAETKAKKRGTAKGVKSAPKELERQAKLIRASKNVHSKWYLDTYEDAARAGIDPSLHYLLYGAAMGRNPGKSFDTQFYLDQYPEVRASGLNPLLHYVEHGQKHGYKTKAPKDFALRDMKRTKDKLLSLGFTDKALDDLQKILANSPDEEVRTLAARELVLWHMRSKTSEGYATALHYAQQSHASTTSLDHRRRMVTAILLCQYFLGLREEASTTYEEAALVGELSPDAMLAWINFQETPEARITWINHVLQSFAIPPIGLLPDEGQPLYDRLTAAEPAQKITDGPKVTVLVAAYEAADVLPTALRSLQEQSWQNLEILVLDDCSPSSGTCDVTEKFAATDPRIRLIRMEQNGGAYVARNRGLDEATGTYVTLHDADDWSHPLKIETQVRFMEDNPDVMGCTTQQSRATEDLVFWRMNADGKLLNLNTSSFMFRREEVQAACGYWDDVRFGADTELIKRMTSAFGKNCVKRLFNGPFSFQRISDSSIVGSPYFGIEGFHFGVRFLYHEAYRHYHFDESRPNYHNNQKKLFATPNVMRKDRLRVGTERHFDVIIASDFRMAGGSTRSSIEEMLCHEKFGISHAHFHMFRYDFETERSVFSVLGDNFDSEHMNVLGYGENASCDLLILRYPPILQHRQRYLPKINAKHIKVIVNQPPMSDYSELGEVRYDLASCAENVRHYFGKDAQWHPIGPLVREALHTHHAHELPHITLSEQDWLNVIDIEGWSRGPRQRSPQDKLRIGRHSRDHEHKWPHRREDILAAYPASDDVEVHVLGGASAPATVIGDIPQNWTVHPFGSLHPREFLADIDVYIYFAHPDWVESFGRVIIEAMAVGVPVILPEIYRPLFQDSVLYATPATAMDLARTLHGDPAFYDAQVRKAQQYVQDNFSYETHVERLKRLQST
ncbi:glycosyltransferase [Sphingobium scionense]|uniref:Glycosyltransferase involved in cell wall biosynthesis n=1 Tax=Sphingobium scionense TaxID=1404341 RepID=A0A7W6PX46_9SPHN|nr:glycosyltransferase [Sphingobium scionense]MBB4148590.1 glycosyltransferase involved in cell wall biosynthesis [Sphingobium scionense]